MFIDKAKHAAAAADNDDVLINCFDKIHEELYNLLFGKRKDVLLKPLYFFIIVSIQLW